jgi:hypothetical protein
MASVDKTDGLPAKSRALAIVLAVLFGPFGLLYWSPKLAGVLLIGTFATLGLGLVITWPWAIFAAVLGPPNAWSSVQPGHRIH